MLYGIVNLGTFIISGIILNITPGNDTMYIIGRSISQGRKAGIFSALGIGTGCLFHITATAFGLSAIIAASEILFTIIKSAGAAYLFYLGIRMLLSKFETQNFLELKHDEYLKIYKQGVFTNVLNPKVALFFIAFLPQFVLPGFAAKPLPFLILGCIFLTTGTIWCLFVAVFSAHVTQTLRNNTKVKFYLEKCTGVLFILLGIKLFF